MWVENQFFHPQQMTIHQSAFGCRDTKLWGCSGSSVPLALSTVPNHSNSQYALAVRLTCFKAFDYEFLRKCRISDFGTSNLWHKDKERRWAVVSATVGTPASLASASLLPSYLCSSIRSLLSFHSPAPAHLYTSSTWHSPCCMVPSC